MINSGNIHFSWANPTFLFNGVNLSFGSPKIHHWIFFLCNNHSELTLFLGFNMIQVELWKSYNFKITEASHLTQNTMGKITNINLTCAQK